MLPAILAGPLQVPLSVPIIYPCSIGRELMAGTAVGQPQPASPAAALAEARGLPSKRAQRQRIHPMPYIGIDFGTSHSVVAHFHYGQAEVIPNQEGQKWTPSVVTLRRDGSLAFGQEAKENFDEQRSIRSIKRILGSSERVPLIGQNLRPEQIAVMLFSLLKKDAEQQLN